MLMKQFLLSQPTEALHEHAVNDAKRFSDGYQHRVIALLWIAHISTAGR